MKKLFISCPMRGRTEDNIKKTMRKMHKMAEIIFEQELEVIDSYIEQVPETKNQRIWCLGKSIQMLAEADFYIGVSNVWDFEGCQIENRIASAYNIESTLIDVNDITPDLRKHACSSVCGGTPSKVSHCEGTSCKPIQSDGTGPITYA